MKRLLIVLLVLTACRKNTSPDVAKSVILPASGTEVVAAENQFSLGFFQAVNAQDTALKNKIISPFSMYMALAMVDNGASGATQDSIGKALRLGTLSVDDLNGTASSLMQQLPKVDNRVTLSVANSEWYDQHLTPLASFSQTLQTVYQAKVQAMNFSDPSTVTTINQWVAGQTQQMIPHILQKIDPAELMFLVNAIYFKGTWTTAFDGGLTKDASFTRGDGVVENVPTMTTANASSYSFLGNDTVTIVELPYGGQHFVMDILEPASGIRTLSAELTPGMLTDWINRLSPQSFIVTLPRFKFNYAPDNLRGALTHMGMGIAFSDQADFSHMYTIPTKISRVIHQAAIEVDESGTKAAAATAIGIDELSARSGPTVIRIDHAFLFVIRETTSGAVLFIGIVNDPAM